MGKKKGGGKAEEDRIELVRLRYHVEESEKRLQEQVKTAQHLREVHVQKTQEYDSLQKDADRMCGDYQRQVEYMEEELTTKEEDLRHTITMLETELRRVTNELDCCRTFEEENKTLKQTMRELREEVDSKEVAHADDLFKQKKEAYRQQTMMESELQRMVREMEDKYRAQAFAALDEESRDAIVAKGQMELKFLRQDETVQSMNERFDKLEESNGHLTRELELTGQRLEAQTVKTQKQQRELSEAREKNFALERDLRLATLECQTAQSKCEQVESMAHEVEEMKKKLRIAEKKAAKWKGRAIDIAKLSAQTPHGAFEPQKGKPHGAFGKLTTHKEDGDSDCDIVDQEGMDDDLDDEEADLRTIWHAAFAPTSKAPKRREVSSAPGGTRAKAINKKGAVGARSSTSMGLRRQPDKRGGDMRSNQFANFSVDGTNVRGDSASSRRTGSSRSSGSYLPSVPGHVQSAVGIGPL